MRGVLILVLFAAGCVASQGIDKQGPKKEDFPGGRWRVITTKEDFVRRYPGLPLEYMEKMRRIEKTVKEGEALREDYFGTDPKNKHYKRKLLDEAVKTYVEALNEAEKVYRETGCDAVMVFLSRTVGAALKRLLVEYERWRRIEIE